MVEDKEVTEEEIQNFVKGRLARYKWLDGGVRFVDTIPRTASGKVLKVRLRETDKEMVKKIDAGTGENIKGVKAENPLAKDITNGQKTEGEKFNERIGNGIDMSGRQTNGVSIPV